MLIRRSGLWHQGLRVCHCGADVVGTGLPAVVTPAEQARVAAPMGQ